MGRNYTGVDVFDASIQRLRDLYGGGHRVVCSFSAGKDSGIVLELAIIAATLENRLPVEVLMRDEEIMLPGTFEYAERVAARPEVDFKWVYANQPIVNAFNRAEPFWWVFDPLLDPSEWVRQPPDFAQKIDQLSITKLITKENYPPDDGFDLVVCLGLRAGESRSRMFGLHASGGYLTKVQPGGYRKARPIYDWTDGDIWKAIKDNGWDYNQAYDTMHRFGVNRRELRIAPPTMRAASIEILQIASKAWPQWFDRVATRCPGTRTAAQFGRRAVTPIRRAGETWEDCFKRTCLVDAPEWIKPRAQFAMQFASRKHSHHSPEPISQVKLCPRCPSMASWQQLALMLYMGDPFSFAVPMAEVEPDYFRPGSGTWGGGKPSW